MSRRALVVGGMSQSGRLLVRSLLEDGYEVIATTRRTKDLPSGDKVLWYGGIDFQDPSVDALRNLGDMILGLAPNEIYNLASVMYAPASWDAPVGTYQVNLLPCVQILHTMRDLKDISFVQAGSAEMFKRSLRPLSIDSPIAPTTPYGISKFAAYLQVHEARKKYGTRACTAIFTNMESTDRDDFFFARKAVLECIRVYRDHQAGKEPAQMTFGPLWARRDWGLTREYVQAMRLMAVGEPVDRVIGTGECRTCYQFLYECLMVLGIPQYWPVILNEKKDLPAPAAAYDCIYASQADMQALGIKATGFSGVVRELVEGELRKSG